MFKNPWPAGAPFEGENRQHVEYLKRHPAPDDDRTTRVMLHVDNRDRDIGFDAHRGQSAPFNFVARFDTINDVTAVRLRTFSCPKPPGEPYVVLDIPQFGSQLYSTDDCSHQKFAAVYFDQPVSQAESKPVRTDMISCVEAAYDSPTQLNRLDVAIRSHGGRLLTDAYSSNVVSFVLEVTCKQVSGTYGL